RPLRSRPGRPHLAFRARILLTMAGAKPTFSACAPAPILPSIIYFTHPSCAALPAETKRVQLPEAESQVQEAAGGDHRARLCGAVARLRSVGGRTSQPRCTPAAGSVRATGECDPRHHGARLVLHD